MDSVLIVSLGALVVGPAVAATLGRAPRARAGLEGFVVVSVVGLVFVHILPHSVELGGWWALVAAAFGVVIPMAMHRGLHGHGREAGHEVSAALVLALNALAIHAFLDGFSLTGWKLDDPGATALVAAVILHRLPAGMAIWWVAQPRVGGPATLGVLLLVCLATWAGFSLIPGGLGAASEQGLGLFQALMAGSLLHVALDHGPNPGPYRRGARTGGAAAGAAILAVMASLEPRVTPGLAVELLAIAVIAGWVVLRRPAHRI